MLELKRYFVQKRPEFAAQSHSLLHELSCMFNFISTDDKLDIWHCYDVQGDLSTQQWDSIVKLVLSEPNADVVCKNSFKKLNNAKYFAKRYLPGQYDQRADSALQCISAIVKQPVKLLCTSFIGIQANISDIEFNKIKSYLINEVDSYEVSQKKPNNLDIIAEKAKAVELYMGFILFDNTELLQFYNYNGFAMSFEDLKHCQAYFKAENRDPNECELKVIDTYWSDHCRHTTFATHLNNIEFEACDYLIAKKRAFDLYIENKNKYSAQKPITLMDIATIGVKEMKARGLLSNLDQSEEINACSIKVPVIYDKDNEQYSEDYLLQFKNETHNHPTEIEPFGGAATCLGGAIRDPLSGRAYVYGSMRITGAGDPRESLENTLKSKLPQRKITKEAAKGFSSYGNQIGLATGEVREYYHPNFRAKRLELGAVIAAVPEKYVKRETPKKGDIVVILGGATGRDGCGGATGSSKAHNTASVETAGAEVQKGNAPEERKLQRLFRNPEFTLCIKRCNDFGAGGVAVAVGELSDGLDINLDSLPKKYEGLNGTELAISESQERMAIVIASGDLNKVIRLAESENLTATQIASINDENTLRMYWQSKLILELKREFLDTNGAKMQSDVVIGKINSKNSPFKNRDENNMLLPQSQMPNKDDFINCASSLANASQRALCEMFDNTIGANSVYAPYGGKTQSSKINGMVFTIPVEQGQSRTTSIMTHGYDPHIASFSPYHGGIFSAVLAVSKAVALGCNYKDIRLSCQEYFESLKNNPLRYGKPMVALLGNYEFQSNMGIASIGGKDSMSGSFEDIDVPPSLITFAVASESTLPSNCVLSTEFKNTDSYIVYIPISLDNFSTPNYASIKKLYDFIYKLRSQIRAINTVENSIAQALISSCFGNEIGIDILGNISLFDYDPGSFIIELAPETYSNIKLELSKLNGKIIATTKAEASISFKDMTLPLSEIKKAWEAPLNDIFNYYKKADKIHSIACNTTKSFSNINIGIKPNVLIPVFPGTNCEWDMQMAFEKAGGNCNIFVLKNRNSFELEQSIIELTKQVESSHIIALSGGFSAGDEPEGSGKYISAILRNAMLSNAINKHVDLKRGLIIGICNGFQALIKSGLLPYGQIRDLDCDSPTLSFNKISRHISRFVNTKLCTVNTPWAGSMQCNDIHSIPISHGEGRFMASDAWINKLVENGQVFTRYCDSQGQSYSNGIYNPNGSSMAIEGIISQNGLILGKMGHSERYGENLHKNIYGNKYQDIFQGGVNYFK